MHVVRGIVELSFSKRQSVAARCIIAAHSPDNFIGHERGGAEVCTMRIRALWEDLEPGRESSMREDCFMLDLGGKKMRLYAVLMATPA